jgi:glycosyltransferase involved in cell wall biosynthesis
MRILISIHHALDLDTGAPGVTLRLADALRGRGHAVDILSFDRVPLPPRFRGYVYPWFVAWFVATHPRYDVLDLSSGDGWVLSLVPALFRASIPVIAARSHGLEHIAHDARLVARRSGEEKLSWKYPFYHGGYRLWECATSFSHAHVALFLNDVDRTYAVERLGLAPHRAVLVKNGIANCFVHNARRLLAQAPPPDAPRHIAFVGRYTEMKGRAELRLAMRPLLSEYAGLTLGLFGTVADADAVLADYPCELRERICVVPTFKNDELPRLLASYDIFAFPSRSEGFAIAPLEAMACGLVPVVTATPGPMSYIENGRNGIVVPLRDAEALRKAIASLLDDPPRWRELRANAVATACGYSWDGVAAEIEGMYAGFAARRESKARSGDAPCSEISPHRPSVR